MTRLAIIKYLEGSPLPSPAGLSLTKDGLPTVLGPLNDSIRQRDFRVVSAVLSVLSTTKALLGGTPVDVSTLTLESTMKQVPDYLAAAVPSFFKAFNQKSFDSS